jgi:hypothetical protein
MQHNDATTQIDLADLEDLHAAAGGFIGRSEEKLEDEGVYHSGPRARSSIRETFTT